MSASKIWLTAKREYLERVRSGSFLIMTMLIPTLLALFAAADFFVAGRLTVHTHVGVVTSNVQLAGNIQRRLMDSGKEGLTVEIFSSPTQALIRSLDERVIQGELDEYLSIMSSDPARPLDVSITRQSGIHFGSSASVEEATNRALVQARLAEVGVSADRADALLQPARIEQREIGRKTRPAAAYISVAFFFFLMYVVLMMYGMNVARSVIEEKSSRIFEVLLASIQPDELLAGKVVGVGSVGLTQVTVWIVAAILVSVAAGAFRLPDLISSVQFSLLQGAFFLIFFLLGYFFYAAVGAGLGALCSNDQELQQLSLLLVMPLLLAFTIAILVLVDPDGASSTILSLIPFFSPLLMYLRITLFTPPAWQIAFSIALLLLSIGGLLYLSARIYRVGILLSGKRPTLPELLRLLQPSS